MGGPFVTSRPEVEKSNFRGLKGTGNSLPLVKVSLPSPVMCRVPAAHRASVNRSIEVLLQILWMTLSLAVSFAPFLTCRPHCCSFSCTCAVSGILSASWLGPVLRKQHPPPCRQLQAVPSALREEPLFGTALLPLPSWTWASLPTPGQALAGTAAGGWP